SRRRHTRFSRDWSSDVCSSDLQELPVDLAVAVEDLEFTQPFDLGAGAVETGERQSRSDGPPARPVLRAHRELDDPSTVLHPPGRSEERRVGKGQTYRVTPRSYT